MRVRDIATTTRIHDHSRVPTTPTDCVDKTIGNDRRRHWPNGPASLTEPKDLTILWIDALQTMGRCY